MKFWSDNEIKKVSHTPALLELATFVCYKYKVECVFQFLR